MPPQHLDWRRSIHCARLWCVLIVISHYKPGSVAGAELIHAGSVAMEVPDDRRTLRLLQEIQLETRSRHYCL